MDQEYDFVILGTGLTECILSGVLSMEGNKVLHLDQNKFYGGECASLNLSQLFERFKSSEEAPKGKYGRDRDYNVDIVPKFMMASGELVDILVHTDVVRYLEFQQIAGSYVFLKGKGLYKVPASESEALTSPLLGLFEKTRVVRFLHYVKSSDPEDPSTWGEYDLKVKTMKEVYSFYGLDSNSQDMLGHALALHPDDAYVNLPGIETFKRIRLYMNSLARYGKSPYIYPLYGLGELPQGFARLSAIYGGTYMLDTPMKGVTFSEDGKISGVKTDGGIAKCKAVIASSSYFPEFVKQTKRVVRAVCLLNHPIPGTGESDSCQIIIPQRQLKRSSDVYVVCLSSSHQVCPPGFYVAIVSTVVETEDPHEEIKPALDLIGTILEKYIFDLSVRFVWISKVYEPTDDGKSNGIFLTKSYDPSSHFESVCDDVKDVYQRLTGKSLVLKQRLSAEEEQKVLESSLESMNLSPSSSSLQV